jgi:hypothetical protein
MAAGVGEKGGGAEKGGWRTKAMGVLDPYCKLGRLAIGYAQLKWLSFTLNAEEFSRRTEMSCKWKMETPEVANGGAGFCM